jgi:hypothetical protein
VLGLETLLVLSPLLSTDYPPLSDLINHMARIYIIADAGKDPVLAAMYHPVWHVMPNLAIDLIGPTLVRLTSVSTAARILLALAILLCLYGTIVFHRATFEVRSYWPFAVGLVLYNGEFLLGFMNFVIGSGLALLAAAATISQGGFYRRVRVPLSCIAAPIIFFCHGWALILYFILIGVDELCRLIRAGDGRLATLGQSAVRVVLPAIIPVLLVFFAAPHANFLTPRPNAESTILWGSMAERASMAASPFINYSPMFDLTSLFIVVGLFAFLIFRGALLIPLSTRLTISLLGVLFLACPFGISGATFLATFLNARFALFIALMVFAGICPRGPNSNRWVLLAGCLALLLVVRIVVVEEVWRSSRQDIADLRTLGAFLPRGSRVLATRVNPDEDCARYFHDQPAGRQLLGLLPNTWFLPSLWVIERQVFFPLLFTNPALQPLEVTDADRGLSMPIGIPPDYRALFDPGLAAQEVKDSPYLAHWEQNFDYVVILNAGRANYISGLDTLPLGLVGKTDIAALYRILR